MTPIFDTPLAGARYERAVGRATIPCGWGPNAKDALAKWGMYKRERPTEAKYRAWEMAYPGCNWASLNGCYYDVCTVDVDTENPFGMLGTPPETVTVKSPGGPFKKHYKFKTSSLTIIRNFTGGYYSELPGLDLKADGGYSMCVGSFHPNGGQYQYVEGHGSEDVPMAQLSDWPALFDYISTYNERKEREQAEWEARAAQIEAEKARGFTINREKRERPDRVRRYAETALQNRVNELRSTGKNQRNTALFKAAASLSRYITAGALNQATVEYELEKACVENRLVADDGLTSVRRTIESGLRAGRYNPILLADHHQSFRSK